MNAGNKHIFLLSILILTAVMVQSGCAKKTGVEMAERTRASMQDVSSDMEQASAQLDATQASLERVIDVGQSPASLPSDVKQAYVAFSENVEKMDEVASRLNKHIDEMNARGNEYFVEWSESGSAYTDPEIQQLSQQRRIDLRRSFTEIASASAGMRGTLNSYLSDIKQIDTYLSNDLSAEGIAAIAPIAQAAKRNGDSLKQSFQPVHSSIEQARPNLIPGGIAAGGAAGETGEMPETRGESGGASTDDSGTSQ